MIATSHMQTLLLIKSHVHLGMTIFQCIYDNKPNKFEMKLFLLCGSATDYTLNVTAYTWSTSGINDSIQPLFDQLCADCFERGIYMYLYGSCLYNDYLYTVFYGVKIPISYHRNYLNISHTHTCLLYTSRCV